MDNVAIRVIDARISCIKVWHLIYFGLNDLMLISGVKVSLVRQFYQNFSSRTRVKIVTKTLKLFCDDCEKEREVIYTQSFSISVNSSLSYS